MRPSDLQHKELQRVTMVEFQAKVAELEDKNESLTSQNSELIKKTYGLELEKQELADEVLWVKTINLKLKKNLNLTPAWNNDLQNTVCFHFLYLFLLLLFEILEFLCMRI